MNVLAADDDQGVLLALELLLRQARISMAAARNPPEVLAKVSTTSFDVLLLDLNYAKDTTSGGEGFSLLSQLRQLQPRTPILVMTGWASIEGAVEAMQRGATDYISKPWDNDRLLKSIRKFDPAFVGGNTANARIGVFGTGPAMRQILQTVDQVAFSDVSILITGEHGTGKEVLARLVHERSQRRGPLIAVNAGGLPESMLESELFGHVRGAFTDAKTDRQGAFAEAQDGTLFLDEIANMPAPQQTKLLRVLQERTFRALGSSTAQLTTARVLSATNADIADEVRQSRFRADLFYRLNTIHLHVPPLRERRDEIPMLARRFVEEACARYGLPVLDINPHVVAVLCAHDWPGNVRELEHTIQRAVLLSATAGRITSASLTLTPSVSASNLPGESKLKDAERDLILRALQRFPEDRLAAARSLGLSRSAFYRRLQQFGIKPSR